MSNILEQSGISYVPINKEKTVINMVKDFCGFLNNAKTPIDIFECIQINDVKYSYAAEYVTCVDFTLDWEATVTKNLNGEMTNCLDKDHADCTVAVTVPANTNKLNELDKNFFVDSSYIMLALAQHITEDIKLIKENEIGKDALEFCLNNTSDIQNFDIKSMINEQINSRVDEICRERYKDYYYELNYANVNTTNENCFTVLVPILIVNYTYNGESYHCIINAHSNSKASIISHKGVYVGTLPKDKIKGKGLFGKIKSAADKIKHKNQQKKIYEQKYISIFQSFIK